MNRIDGKVSSVDDFTRIMVDVMAAMNITVDRLKDPTKKRTPNGFPEALAKALNDAELLDGGPANWNAKTVSKRFKAWQEDGSLFQALEFALHSEQSEPVAQPEPEPASTLEPIGATNSDRSERSDHMATLADLEQPEHSEREPLPLEPPRSEPSERQEHTGEIVANTEPQAPNPRSDKQTDEQAVTPSLPSECSEQLTIDQITGHLTPIIKEVAMAVCQEMINEKLTALTVPHVPNSDESDIPPEPETLKGSDRGGRRQIREYVKLSATIDAVLFEKFRSECKERGLSVGRMLDAILWNRYDRPALSYQREDAEERAKARPKRHRSEQ